MALNHHAQRLFLNQRHVAAQNQNVSLEFSKGVFSAQHGVAGAKLLLLRNPSHIVARVSASNRVGAMANDDRDSGRFKPLGSLQGMEKQRFASEGMEHFRQDRFHSSALPR